MPNWKKVVVSGSSAQLLNITASGQVSASLGIHGVLQTPNSINSDNYVDGSIDAAHLAANAVETAKINDDAVTYAKMQNLGTANRVLGATSTGAIGEVQVVTAMIANDAIEEEQIGDGEVKTAAIADANVTLAKMANLAQSTIIGRAASAGTGVPTALTATQVRSLLNVANGATAGGGGIFAATGSAHSTTNQMLSISGSVSITGSANSTQPNFMAISTSCASTASFGMLRLCGPLVLGSGGIIRDHGGNTGVTVGTGTTGVVAVLPTRGLTVGGGFGSTGVTITAAGGISANAALTASSARFPIIQVDGNAAGQAIILGAGSTFISSEGEIVSKRSAEVDADTDIKSVKRQKADGTEVGFDAYNEADVTVIKEDLLSGTKKRDSTHTEHSFRIGGRTDSDEVLVMTSKAVKATAPLTASGDISSSGKMIANSAQFGVTSVHIDGPSGHLTASGNISASGTITGLTGSFNKGIINLPSAVANEKIFQVQKAGSNVFYVDEDGDGVFGGVIEFKNYLYGSSGNTFMGGRQDLVLGMNWNNDTTGTSIKFTKDEFDISPSNTLMTISSSGNVGIGTTTPGEKLEVIGNISASGNVTASNIAVDEYIHHKGDNTYIRFLPDRILAVASNNTVLNLNVGGDLVEFGHTGKPSVVKGSTVTLTGNVTASGEISASLGFVGDLVGTSSFAAAVAQDSITVGMMKANSVDSDQYVDDSIDTAHYAAGSVDATALASNAVTNAKLADNAVDTAEIAASAVETAKINDDAVTYAKMQNLGTANRVLGATSTGAIGEVQVVTAMIANDAIEEEQIGDGEVKTAAIADDAVTYAKIQNVSATNVVLGRDSSGAGVIEEIAAADLVTMLGIEASATADQSASEILTAIENGVDSVHYVNASIDAEHLASNSVTNAKLADNAVDTAEIAASAVETAKINNLAVSTAKIADNAVTGDKIEDNPTIAGNLAVNGTTTLGNATTDTVTIAGNITASNMTGSNIDLSGDLDFTATTANISLNGSSAILFQSTQAIFTQDIRTGDGKGIKFGVGSDYRITHAGTAVGETKMVIKEGTTSRWTYGIGGHLSASAGVNIHLGAGVQGGGEFRGESANITNITASANISASGFIGNLVGTSSFASAVAQDSITVGMMKANSVDSAQYVDDSIDTAHYAAGSVDATALASNAVTNAKLADNAVDTAEIAASAVETAKINNLAVSTAKIADDAVTYAKIQNVTATNVVLGRDSSGAGVIEEIAAADLLTMLGVEASATADQSASEILTAIEDGVDSVHYKDASIDAEHLASNAVTNAKLADNAVDTAEIAASAVETAKINNLAVTTAKIADDAVTGAKIENNPTIAGNLTVNGSSTLGNASTDTIEIAGNITASAAISMSSTGHIQTPDIKGAGTGATQLNVQGQITASGNISSSGHMCIHKT